MLFDLLLSLSLNMNRKNNVSVNKFLNSPIYLILVMHKTVSPII